MPIPTPNGGETESKYVSRCIGFLSGEGYEQDQAAAICYGKWRDAKKMQHIDEVEDDPVRLTQERFAGVGDYSHPPQTISSFDMFEEVDVNPNRVAPERSDLDTLFPVE